MAISAPFRDGRDIYQVLRDRIIEGKYRAGEQLVEERLAEEFGVSRTPIRQTLSRIAADGLIQIFPNRGAFVRTYSPDELRELYDLRALMEGFAAFHAALRVTPGHLARLEVATDEMEAALRECARDREEGVRVMVAQNQAFHRTILEASGYRTLPDLLARVLDMPLTYKSFYWYSPADAASSVFFHRRIVEAMTQRDPERARCLMQEHVYEARDFLLRRLSRQDTAAEPWISPTPLSIDVPDAP